MKDASANLEHLGVVGERLADVEDVLGGARIDDQIEAIAQRIGDWPVQVVDQIGALVVREIERVQRAEAQDMEKSALSDR